MYTLHRILLQYCLQLQHDLEGEVSQAHLSQMKYLECCIKEALRLYPSVPFVGRNIENDTVIDKKQVEKGWTVLIFVHQLHRNPLVWERPEEFIPERFLENT